MAVMSRYAFASHVFACLDGDHVVLLDLKQDRYFSFEAARAHGLDKLVSGWPATVAAGGGGADGDLAGDRVAGQLLERGLLTQHGAAPREALAVAPASTELICDHYEDAPARGAPSVVSFIAAMVTATVVLRYRSLERAVLRVKERRKRGRRDPATLDIDRTRQLVAIFTDLQPFLFTSKDKCLFESLVLIEFLARHGIYPGWVFGVQARPFAAHCWVQQGDVVINDTLEQVARYTPIMAV